MDGITNVVAALPRRGSTARNPGTVVVTPCWGLRRQSRHYRAQGQVGRQLVFGALIDTGVPQAEYVSVLSASPAGAPSTDTVTFAGRSPAPT
jgi:hypothetical protein